MNLPEISSSQLSKRKCLLGIVLLPSIPNSGSASIPCNSPESRAKLKSWLTYIRANGSPLVALAFFFFWRPGIYDHLFEASPHNLVIGGFLCSLFKFYLWHYPLLWQWYLCFWTNKHTLWSSQYRFSACHRLGCPYRLSCSYRDNVEFSL